MTSFCIANLLTSANQITQRLHYMKFKHPAHQNIYREAIKAIHAQHWNEAVQGLQTLHLLLQESREISHANKINSLIQCIQHPVKRETLVTTLLAQNQAQHQANQVKLNKTESFKAEIDALEETAHKEFDNNDFYNSAISYGAVAAKTKDLPQFKENYAAAIWSQASAYESLAYEIAGTTPIKAQSYVDKAIRRVKESLVVYTQLKSDYDIDECTKKLKVLKEYKATLQTQNKQNETTQAELFKSLDKVKCAYAVPEAIDEDCAAMLVALRGTPVYVRGFNYDRAAANELKKPLSDIPIVKDDKTKLAQ